MFDVFVLLYADCTKNAERCLGSIADTMDRDLVRSVRVGLNAVSSRLRRTTVDFLRRMPVPRYIYQDAFNRNVHKYALMRHMIHDLAVPCQASHVMWFDDDSFVKPPREAGFKLGRDWWRLAAAESKTTTLLGSVYNLTQGYRPGQAEGIRQQPWYGDVALQPKPRFVTGGWWVAEREFLRKWDYPFPEILHNGGDSMLGELVRQQGKRMKHFNRGIAINYDKARGGESRAPRRGITTKWPWETGVPAPQEWSIGREAVRDKEPA